MVSTAHVNCPYCGNPESIQIRASSGTNFYPCKKCHKSFAVVTGGGTVREVRKSGG